MKTYDRMLCEAIGRNRRAIAKLERKIQNSMAFHTSRGSTDWPRWEAMGSDLLDMQKDDAELTEKLKALREGQRKERNDAKQ